MNKKILFAFFFAAFIIGIIVIIYLVSHIIRQKEEQQKTAQIQANSALKLEPEFTDKSVIFQQINALEKILLKQEEASITGQSKLFKMRAQIELFKQQYLLKYDDNRLLQYQLKKMREENKQLKAIIAKLKTHAGQSSETSSKQ